ncbi:MAG: 2OG-Fe(II) oxygenase [Bacteriovoracaceae bacterium]|nr:2OG-Fe(II) oxygenase [Bacteriovoracaceae bacterium]
MKFFSQKELKEIALQSAEKIIQAKTDQQFFNEPYKHIVIDNFFPEEVAHKALENFTSIDSQIWEKNNDIDIEIKLRTTWKSEFDIPEGSLEVVRILNSSIFLEAMSERMGIKKLIPDPYFTGGGLNAMMPGGILDVHVDGNYHDATGLNRRMNAILFLNKNWESHWKGEFCIYDTTGLNCIKKIGPIFNRLVIFNSHDLSFHGVPEIVNFPEGDFRKSIILYYYTKDSCPENQIVVKDPHSALWVKKNLHDKKGNKSRKFN